MPDDDRRQSIRALPLFYERYTRLTHGSREFLRIVIVNRNHGQDIIGSRSGTIKSGPQTMAEI